MKRYILACATAMTVAISAMGQTNSITQTDTVAGGLTENDIMFGIVVNQPQLSEANATLLATKMEQIVGRCNAGASGNDGVFVIEPKISVGETMQSEGLMQNVASMTGELVLSAKQRYDGSVFYTVTVPLKAVAKGDNPDADNLLIKSIKPSDATYVRFIRNARANILKYVEDHPEILTKPEKEAPTPQQPAIVIIVNEVKPDPKPEPQPAPQPQPVPTPVAKPEPTPVPIPVSAPQPQITISEPGWDIKVKGCTYDPTSRSITITLSITNTADNNRSWEYTALNNVIKPDGTTFKEFGFDNSHRDYPGNVPVTVKLYIKNVSSNPGELTYVDIRMSRAQVEIRNLPVK